MHPYLYLAYLCLLESNHPVRLAFKRSKSFNLEYGWSLERAVNVVVRNKADEYRRKFIFSAWKEWSNFEFTKFMKFLNRYRNVK